jgi:hypothetical protein
MIGNIRRATWTLGVLGVTAALVACRPDRTPARREAVVDSALSIDTLLARFREDLDRPAAFSGGAASLDALIERFVRAVEHDDSAAFRGMALTRAEFAWLYYPHLPEAAPPFELEPGLMWFMIETNSGRGLRNLLGERGGRPLGVVGYACEDERHHGPVTIWVPCVLRRLQAEADTVSEGLFGPIVSRDGEFKFVSFANKL